MQKIPPDGSLDSTLALPPEADLSGGGVRPPP
jgi:hypothetical protein